MTGRPPGARSLRIEELMTISANLLNKAAAGEVTPALSPFVRNIAHDLAKRIFYVEDLLAALDRAEAFLADVNWYEIAEHMIEDYREGEDA